MGLGCSTHIPCHCTHLPFPTTWSPIILDKMVHAVSSGLRACYYGFRFRAALILHHRLVIPHLPAFFARTCGRACLAFTASRHGAPGWRNLLAITFAVGQVHAVAARGSRVDRQTPASTTSALPVYLPPLAHYASPYLTCLFQDCPQLACGSGRGRLPAYQPQTPKVGC